jgi:DNA repair protein RecN (Recombination protein N)
MISQINIGKYLYFENISIELSDRLNVFTGETGAGKSLIIDAIEFVLGKRGNWEEKTYVELVFENVDNQFSEEGILIISREIKNNKSVFYINGKRATRSTVQEASKDLIEIHAQHHQQELFKQDFYRDVLDRFSNLQNLLEKYQHVYKKYLELRKKEKEILEKQADRLRELDILKFQLKELKEANIKEGEKEELENRYRYLSQIQDIKETVLQASYLLEEGENSVLDNLSFIIKSLEKIKDVSPVIEDVFTVLNEAKVLIQEAGFSINNMELDFDAGEFSYIEERLNLINKLEIKYNTDEKGLLRLVEEFENRISFLENLEFKLPEIQETLRKYEGEVFSLAEKISQIRKEKADELSKNVEEHLKELGLNEVSFVVLVEDKEIDRYGKDKITFLFSANKGFSPEPLNLVASGGEISRISLALKLLSGSKQKSVVFDEIDTGLGGKTANLLAEKIKKLSENNQILLVTHLPQIAICADKHFYVEKDHTGEKTTGKIKELKLEERKEEIARMLTGKITKETLELAEKLLSG